MFPLDTGHEIVIARTGADYFDSILRRQKRLDSGPYDQRVLSDHHAQ
jgi:hypothetical protein